MRASPCHLPAGLGAGLRLDLATTATGAAAGREPAPGEVVAIFWVCRLEISATGMVIVLTQALDITTWLVLSEMI